MTELYLVRHGETGWSRDGRHTSVTDLDLTDYGVEQGRQLAGELDPSAFGLVLSSPRRRARRTAELAGFDPAALVIDDDLAEWFYGEYEGRTSAEIHATRPGWTIWNGTPSGGESAAEVQARVGRVIERAMTSGEDRVICFAHGHILRALTLTWLGLDYGLGDHFPLGTGTVGVLGPYKDGHGLLRWNSRT